MPRWVVASPTILVKRVDCQITSGDPVVLGPVPDARSRMRTFGVVPASRQFETTLKPASLVGRNRCHGMIWASQLETTTVVEIDMGPV